MCASCQSSDGTGHYCLWWGSSQTCFAHWQLLVACKELVKQLELNWHLGSNGNFLIIQCSAVEADIHSHVRGSCLLPCYVSNLTGTLFCFNLWWEREMDSNTSAVCLCSFWLWPLRAALCWVKCRHRFLPMLFQGDAIDLVPAVVKMALSELDPLGWAPLLLASWTGLFVHLLFPLNFYHVQKCLLDILLYKLYAAELLIFFTCRCLIASKTCW